MIGAMIGDIAGSRFEFDRSPLTVDGYEIFDKDCCFTDDTVMTAGVAEGLMDAGKDADVETIKRSVTRSMRKMGELHPGAGYGGMFYSWVLGPEEMAKPYNSFGNGSAMRVSAAGWLYDSLERTREVARATAEVSHNHPEGIKGAESVAAAIYMARTGSTKEEIRKYVEQEFGYDLSRTCDEIRPTYYHMETCQETVPQAFAAFLEGNSFEGVVRLAISLGGDCDTLTDIAAAMGEAFHGVDPAMEEKALTYLTEDLKDVYERFQKEKRTIPCI